MFKIIGNTRINNFTVIACIPPKELNINAVVMRLFDGKGSVFETSEFDFEEFTQCFSTNKTFSIVTKENIPEKFLMKGNIVELY